MVLLFALTLGEIATERYKFIRLLWILSFFMYLGDEIFHLPKYNYSCAFCWLRKLHISGLFLRGETLPRLRKLVASFFWYPFDRCIICDKKTILDFRFTHRMSYAVKLSNNVTGQWRSAYPVIKKLKWFKYTISDF